MNTNHVENRFTTQNVGKQENFWIIFKGISEFLAIRLKSYSLRLGEGRFNEIVQIMASWIAHILAAEQNRISAGNWDVLKHNLITYAIDVLNFRISQKNAENNFVLSLSDEELRKMELIPGFKDRQGSLLKNLTGVLDFIN